MVPSSRRGPAVARVRLGAAVLATVLLILTSACSDAPTEQEIAMADDGVNPSIVSIFTSEELLPVVRELGTRYRFDHSGVTFLFTAKDPEGLATTTRTGTRPALWIDWAEALAPVVSDPGVVGSPVPVGDDVMQFLVTRNYGQRVPLEVFGAGDYPVASVLCATTLPCGPAARAILEQAGVTPKPDATLARTQEILVAMRDDVYQTTLMYRSNASSLFTAFRVIALPDPTIGARAIESLRFTEDAVGADFQSWIAESPEAQEILVKRGFRDRPGLQTL